MNQPVCKLRYPSRDLAFSRMLRYSSSVVGVHDILLIIHQLSSLSWVYRTTSPVLDLPSRSGGYWDRDIWHRKKPLAA